MNVRKNARIMIDPYMTSPDILKEFFTEVQDSLHRDTYRAKRDVTIICKGQRVGHLAIVAAAAGLNRTRDCARQLTNFVKSQKATDEDQVLLNILENRKRLLWVSRHNMDMRAYRTIMDKFGSLTLVIPIDVRVISGDEILRIVEANNCDIVVAVLPDDIINDVREKLTNIDVTFLRYVGVNVKTGANFVRSGSTTIQTRIDHRFSHFDDIRSGEVIEAVDDDKHVCL